MDSNGGRAGNAASPHDLHARPYPDLSQISWALPVLETKPHVLQRNFRCDRGDTGKTSLLNKNFAPEQNRPRRTCYSATMEPISGGDPRLGRKRHEIFGSSAAAIRRGKCKGAFGEGLAQKSVKAPCRNDKERQPTVSPSDRPHGRSVRPFLPQWPRLGASAQSCRREHKTLRYRIRNDDERAATEDRLEETTARAYPGRRRYRAMESDKCPKDRSAAIAK